MTSYLALYRKYRPNSLNELVGQKRISNVLKNEILLGKISHAYLFSGPRGTGKTSAAKIIAKMVNCKDLSPDGMPCGKCINCQNFRSSNDIVEIDAASNNGVDEIRNIREKVNLVPSNGKYKVYIIDEVHMLTTQAFNALLKTLEEPPSHVIFILATTEFYKIPSTVVSRCQKFQFLKFTNDEIVSRLKKIAELEKINVDDAAFYEIARLSDGGMRDAINMLDQLSAFKNEECIFLEDVYKLNGVVSYEEFNDLLLNLKSGNISDILSFVENIDLKGMNINKIISSLLEYLKELLVYKSTSDVSEVYKFQTEKLKILSCDFSFDEISDLIDGLVTLLSNMKVSNFSKLLLISFFVKESIKYSKNSKNEEITEFDKKFNSEDLFDSSKEEKVEISKNNDYFLKKRKVRINNSFATASKQQKHFFLDRWREMDNLLMQDKYQSLISIIDDIEVMVVGDENVLFLVKYDSLIDRIYNYLDVIEEFIYDLILKKYKVVFVTNDEWIFEKNKYVDSIRSGKKYDFIKEKEELSKKSDVEIEKLISLVGNEVICYDR